MNVKAVVRLLAGALVLALAGCVAVQPEERTKPAVEDIDEQAEAVAAAGGVVTIGMGSSLTMPMAVSKAQRRGRADLAKLVTARVMRLQADFLEGAEIEDREAVEAWFSGVAEYLRSLVLVGSVPMLERTQVDEGLATAWMLMVEDPGVILEALEVRAPADRQLYQLVKGSLAYSALELEAQQYMAFRLAR